MADPSAVVKTAGRLGHLDEAALEVRIGVLQRMIDKDPGLKAQADVEPVYLETTMGGLDDVKALGRRIMHRWNTELYGIVCGTSANDKGDREAILGAMSLGQAAVIAAVATALAGLGVPAPIAAALAPLIVKRFIWPAKDELCVAWGESIKAAG